MTSSVLPSTVTTFVQQIITYLLPHEPKHVLIACNTATALALPMVRCSFPNLSITGVIEPGAKAAVAAAGNKQVPTIGVIATEATVREAEAERDKRNDGLSEPHYRACIAFEPIAERMGRPCG